ncbi:MAG: hypothetical protein LUH23_06270 [Oscillospiraceae bacterium]|nr:hypothetical protein [Oscillospiraceae bacterium]
MPKIRKFWGDGMLKTSIPYSFECILMELIISLLVCCESYRRHKSIMRLLLVFLGTFGVCELVSLIILPFPIALSYPDGYSYDFINQFADFDMAALTTYFWDYISSRSRFITAPFLFTFFGTALFKRLRKPLVFLASLVGAPMVYLIVNVIINTAAQYTMTRIYPVNLILIVIGYALGWLLSILILRAFPSIDRKLKL